MDSKKKRVAKARPEGNAIMISNSTGSSFIIPILSQRNLLIEVKGAFPSGRAFATRFPKQTVFFKITSCRESSDNGSIPNARP